jgi:3-deoxy-D-manno-octulosonate 8-phosphate phosphatase (KDO 8-P phosphatase)
LDHIKDLYTKLGGRFVSSPADITSRLLKVKAFVFDWDGVFNAGEKTSSTGSTFSEVDSMGINLLRFSYFMRTGKLPLTLIISGEKNDTAFYYSERENFNYSYYKFAHKIKALEFLCKKEHLDASEVCYFFDDVLDIPIAEKCGLRMQVNQKTNPLFTDYCVRNNCTDYLTSAAGGNFAVREAAELLIALGGQYDAVLKARTANEPIYQQYIAARKKVSPQFYTFKDESTIQSDPRGR